MKKPAHISLRNSVCLYLTGMAIAVAGVGYGSYLFKNNEHIRVQTVTDLALMLAALAVVFLLPTAGLPWLYSMDKPRRNQLLHPILVGVCFGLADLLIIEYILPHPPHQSLPPYTQPFPYSVLLYFSGAFETEIFYRLVPLTIGMALYRFLSNGRHEQKAFFVLAVITSLREPLEQFPQGPTWFLAYAFISGFAMNFIQAHFFRVYGFMASLLVRLGHYLVWHIINGMIIQYLVLN